MKKINIYSIILITGLLILIQSCSQKKTTETQNKVIESKKAVPVKTSVIKYEQINKTLDFTVSLLPFEEIYLGFSKGDLGLSFAFGQDGAPDYTEVSYSFSGIDFAYGEYDEYGSNFIISKGFACGSYDCAVAYTDFSDDGYGADEDALVFSVSASL